MQESVSPHPRHLFVCQATRGDGRASCGERWDAAAAADRLKGLCRERGLDVRVTRSGCLGPCAQGPNAMLYPGRAWFQGLSEADLPALVDRLAEPEAGESSAS